MPLSLPPIDAVIVACLAGGAAVRVATAGAAAVRGALPDLPSQALTGIVVGLLVAVAPTVIGRPWPEGTAVAGWGSVPAVLLGEALCGWILGTVAAAACGIGGWGGTILAGTSGLALEGDVPAGDPQGGSLARLGWWIGAMAFLAAGGARFLVVALIASFDRIPVGALGGVGVPPDLAATVGTVPALVLEMAVGLAVPALVAVVAANLAVAIGLRVLGIASPAGIIPTLTALVVLATLVVMAPAWGDRAAVAAWSILDQAGTLVPHR